MVLKNTGVGSAVSTYERKSTTSASQPKPVKQLTGFNARGGVLAVVVGDLCIPDGLMLIIAL